MKKIIVFLFVIILLIFTSTSTKANAEKKGLYFEKNDTKNLFNGKYSKYLMYGDSGSIVLSKGKTARTYICKVKPNTTYTVIKSGKSERFVIATSSKKISGGTFDGAINVSASYENQKTFTTGKKDKYLYINVSNKSKEPNIEIYEGTVSEAEDTYKIVGENPGKNKIRIKKIGDNEFLILYAGESGNSVGYRYGLVTNPGIGVDVWRLIDTKIYDKKLNPIYTICEDWFDMEGVLKISGENDYVGGVHGDEKFSTVKIYINDMLFGQEKSSEELSNKLPIDTYCSSVKFIVESTINHADSSTSAFNKVKTVIFNSEGVRIKNNWKALNDMTLTHVRGCMFSINKFSNGEKLISTYADSTVNKEPQKVPDVTDKSIDLIINKGMRDCIISGDLVNAKIEVLELGGSLDGVNARITDFGARIKPYFDCYTETDVKKNEDLHCEFKYIITTP